MIRVALSFVGPLLVAARLASATTFVVPPGPGTPVQDAIDAAAPGDTIRLTAGSYPEHLTITKALKLRGARSQSKVPNDTTDLADTCTANGPMIAIAADSVQVRGLRIVGNLEGGIQIIGRTRVKITDVLVGSNCPGVTTPSLDVVQSTRVSLTKVWVPGLVVPHPAAPAIRIADTPQDGQVRVRSSGAAYHDIGVLLENDGILSVRVSSSYVNYNDRGIVLQNTSRAIIDHNRQVFHNATAGIDLDATSSGNLIVRNEISDSGTDVVDAGTGNCWRNNVYTTGSVAPCP
jgi:nitrous oxidase accessory protein NosD